MLPRIMGVSGFRVPDPLFNQRDILSSDTRPSPRMIYTASSMRNSFQGKCMLKQQKPGWLVRYKQHKDKILDICDHLVTDLPTQTIPEDVARDLTVVESSICWIS